MSKLQELIRELCPDGVEYRKLEDFCEIKTGKGITKSDAVLGGTYPIISGGQSPMGYYHTFNREANTVTISRVGAYAGFVNYIKEQFYLNDKCFSVIPASERVSTLFLFYALKNMESKIKELQSEGGVPTINTTKVSNLEIPVPPIEVQEEIVRILDNFTNLAAELQAELQARQEQYEYYRNKLLTFNELNGVGEKVKWMKMSEIGTFYSGLSGKTKEDFQNGNAKFISYVNIFNNPSLITDVDDRVKILEGEKQNTIQYGDLLFTGSSETPDECGMCSVLTHHTEEKLYLNSFCFGFRFNDLSVINPEFMKFLFRSSVIRKLICKTANGVTRFNISKKEFAKIVIPIPSLAEQDHIASVLDKFYFLVGDLTSGLPAEIEKRRQQYEYYRDQLLTFKRKEA